MLKWFQPVPEAILEEWGVYRLVPGVSTEFLPVPGHDGLGFGVDFLSIRTGNTKNVDGNSPGNFEQTSDR